MKYDEKKRKYDEISRIVNEYKMERGCAHCGFKEDAVALDFHHENRADKIINVPLSIETNNGKYKFKISVSSISVSLDV